MSIETPNGSGKFTRPAVSSTEGAGINMYPLPLAALAQQIKETLTSDDKELLRRVAGIDWTREHVRLSDHTTQEFIAQSLAIGIPVFHPFANFMALTFHPNLDSMRTVNAAKGRKLNQVASIITTKEQIPGIFDFSQLPDGLTEKQVRTLFDTFYDKKRHPYAGPFGFRGPAAEHIPDHLTTMNEYGVRTVQVIAPGYQCQSNEFLSLALQKAGLPYLAVTSANISSNETGREEPAHYRVDGIQQDFGARQPGFIIVGDDHPRKIRKRYPHHEQNSTTIVDISRSKVLGSKTAVYLARHGSLSDTKVAEVITQNGLDLIIDSSARSQLPLRKY